MRLLRSIVLIIVIVAAGAVLAKNLIAKAAMTAGVKSVTGLNLRAGAVDVGLFNTAVGIKDLKVLNPPGYEEPVMISIPEIYVDYDLSDVLRGQIHLTEVRLHLAQLDVVRNTKGELNVQSLKPVQQTQQPAAREQAKREAASRKVLQLQIDLLKLDVGKVSYKDYTGGQPTVQEFDVNLHEEYTNITNPVALGGLIVTRALMRTSVGRLADLDLGAIQAAVPELNAATQALSGGLTTGARQGQAVMNEAAKAGEELAGSASKTVKSTADSLKKLFDQ